MIIFFILFLYGKQIKDGYKIIFVYFNIFIFISIYLFYLIINKNILFLTFINIKICNLSFFFLHDSLSIIMYLIITFISFIIHFYSFKYMKNDQNICRFISFLSLFTFFMLILVSSGNLIQLFLGWEGVGLCSYLLIGYWYNRTFAIKSAIKAILINKIGDISFLILIILTWKQYGDISFINDHKIPCTFLVLSILIASTSKSSQFGLHTWLPDAMEGPTPVSALIHAATMVTAGIFLIIRLSHIIENIDTIYIIMLLLGSLTSIFAASISLTQNDFKKVIAYSTCSQLGYMMMICGLSQYSLSLFHLFNHAFFKALLFLSAGLIIHSLIDEQDIRRSGSIIKSNPITSIFMLIGSFSLMGLPFLTGFYSKDVILEVTIINPFITMCFILSLLAALFTAIYSIRLFYIAFIKNDNNSIINRLLINETTKIETLILSILLIFTLIIGYFISNFLNKEIILINSLYKWLPFISSFIGSIISIIYIELNFKFYNILISSWFINTIINKISSFIFSTIRVLYNRLDQQLLEKIGPSFFKENIINISSLINKGIYSNYLIMIYLIIIYLFINII